MANKILFIEDDKILTSAITEALNSAGIKTVVASDGEEGLKKAREEKPQLILLDLILPKIDGWEVLQKLNSDKNLKGTPTICISAVGTDTSVEECKKLGAKDYLIKTDCTLEQIVETVKKHLKA